MNIKSWIQHGVDHGFTATLQSLHQQHSKITKLAEEACLVIWCVEGKGMRAWLDALTWADHSCHWGARSGGHDISGRADLMGNNSFWFGVVVDSDDARRAEGTPQRQEGQGGRAGQAGRGCLGGSAPAEGPLSRGHRSPSEFGG